MKNKKIENAAINDLKNGYIIKERAIDKVKVYWCLFCSAGFDDGTIYTFGRLMLTAERAIKLHICKEHGSVFENLLSLDKNQTGLTDAQKEFLQIYYHGMAYDEDLTDKDIAEKMNISQSTVRFQRFNFREKAKQAKVILALYELLAEQEEQIKTDKSAEPADENAKMLETLFDSFSPLKLKTFDFKKKREEKRLLIMQTIIQQFEKEKKYNEKEVNEILKAIYDDYATIRRFLIEYGFMDRTGDCREYWVK